MSFASNVRGELARCDCAYICCARSELSAALISSGGISFRGLGRYSLSLTATEGAVARRYFGLLKQYWGVTAQIRTLVADALRGQKRYQLVIPDENAASLLAELELLEETALFGIRSAPGSALTEYACCKKSFLRGAFLMCGTVNDPNRDYHIEIAASTEQFAQYLIGLMNYYEIPAKMTSRKSKYVVYLKKAESLSDFLTLMGAGAARLELENVRIKKDVGNQVNRQMNCDNSNINRTMEAAQARIRDILLLEEQVGLEKLPKSLREIAEIQLSNPEMSLSGMGELMNPPIGKSGVNGRMRKLSELARRLRFGEDTELE